MCLVGDFDERYKYLVLLRFLQKSFYLLRDSLDYCYDCKYCRLNGEKLEEKRYSILPSEINDAFTKFLKLASRYNLSVGYSGLQGKAECVRIWKEKGLDLKPYLGYNFGHKKIIDEKVVALFESLARKK